MFIEISTEPGDTTRSKINIEYLLLIDNTSQIDTGVCQSVIGICQKDTEYSKLLSQLPSVQKDSLLKSNQNAKALEQKEKIEFKDIKVVKKDPISIAEFKYESSSVAILSEADIDIFALSKEKYRLELLEHRKQLGMIKNIEDT